jgi:tetratricopeptide repeat protein 30
MGVTLSQSAVPTHLSQVQEGKLTFTVYSLIRNRKYNDVIRLLSVERQARPQSRAALSLLAYCYFQVHDFMNAAQW